jgi:hypothetical protein
MPNQASLVIGKTSRPSRLLTRHRRLQDRQTPAAPKALLPTAPLMSHLSVDGLKTAIEVVPELSKLAEKGCVRVHRPSTPHRARRAHRLTHGPIIAGGRSIPLDCWPCWCPDKFAIRSLMLPIRHIAAKGARCSTRRHRRFETADGPARDRPITLGDPRSGRLLRRS